jgi:hypothetical protein
LDKPLEDVDIDVASCGSSREVLFTKIEAKGSCEIHQLPESIVDGVVKSAEHYCIVNVCSFVFANDPSHRNSIWHSVVCEIAEDGKLFLAHDPNRNDHRTKLEQFPAIGEVFVVKATSGI